MRLSSIITASKWNFLGRLFFNNNNNFNNNKFPINFKYQSTLSITVCLFVVSSLENWWKPDWFLAVCQCPSFFSSRSGFLTICKLFKHTQRCRRKSLAYECLGWCKSNADFKRNYSKFWLLIFSRASPTECNLLFWCWIAPVSQSVQKTLLLDSEIASTIVCVGDCEPRRVCEGPMCSVRIWPKVIFRRRTLGPIVDPH